MPDETYTLKLVIDGKDVGPEAARIKQLLESQIADIKISGQVKIEGLEMSAQLLRQMKDDAKGVGRAVSSGLGRQFDNLEARMKLLQQGISGLVQAGKGVDITKDIADNMPELEAALDRGEKKAIKQAFALKEITAELDALRKRRAELREVSFQPLGADDVETLGALMDRLTSPHFRRQTKKFVEGIEEDLAPLKEAYRTELEAAQQVAAQELAELVPIFEKSQARLEELRAQQPAYTSGFLTPDQQAQWDKDYATARSQFLQLEKLIEQHRSVMRGSLGTDVTAQIAIERQKQLNELKAQTPFWEEAILGLDQTIETMRQQMRTATADALSELQTVEAQLTKAESRFLRRFKAFQTGGQAELPKGAEGTMVDFVQAEKALEVAASGATDQLERQRRELPKLVKAYDEARRAAEGLSEGQRTAIARMEMIARREITSETKVSKGLSLEEAAEVSRNILMRLGAEVDATINDVQQAMATDVTKEMAKEGEEAISIWQRVKSILVSNSIIPEMVTEINDWLSRIGENQQFSALAEQGAAAARTIMMAFQEMVTNVPTDVLSQQLGALQSEASSLNAELGGMLVKQKEWSRRRLEQFQEAVKQARISRGEEYSEEDEAMYAQGYLPIGHGLVGESSFHKEQRDKAGRLIKGTGETSDEWYRVLNLDLEERKRWTKEELARMERLSNELQAKQAQASAIDVELKRRLVEESYEFYEGLSDPEEMQKAFDTLDKAQRDLDAAKAQLQADLSLVESMAEEQRKNVEGETGAERASGVEESKAAERERLELIKQAGRQEMEMARRVTKVVVAEEKRLTADVTSQVKARQKQKEEAAKRATLKAKSIRQQEVINAKTVAAAEIEEERRITAAKKGEIQQRARMDREAAQIRKKEAQARQLSAEMGIDWQRVIQLQQQSGMTIEEITGALRRAKREAAELNKEHKKQLGTLGRGVTKIENFAENLRQLRFRNQGIMMVAQDLHNLGRTAQMTGTAIVASLTLAGKSYLELAAQSDVAARSLGLNMEMTRDLRNEVINLSADMALLDPKEAARGTTIWAQATGQQVNTLQELRNVVGQVTPMMQLAAMSQVDMASATDATAATLRQFELDLSQTTRVAAIFNQVADDTLAEVEDIAQAFRFVGPQANFMGETVEDTAAILGLFADQNIRGTQAGRALRQTLLSIAEPSDEAREALEGAFGTDSPFYTAEGQFIGFAEMIDMLAAATERMTQAQRDEFIAMIYTANAIPAVTAAITAQEKGRARNINVLRARAKIVEGTIDEEVQGYVQLRKEQDGTTTNLKGALDLWEQQWAHYEESDSTRAKQAKLRWETLWLAIGQSVVEFALPYLERASVIVSDITRWIQLNPWVGKIGALVGAGAITIGTVLATFSTVAKGITTFRTLVQATQGTLSQQERIARDFNTQVVTAAQQFEQIIVRAAQTAATTEEAGAVRETQIEEAGAVREAEIEVASASRLGQIISGAMLGIMVGEGLARAGTGQGMLGWLTTAEGQIRGEARAEGFVGADAQDIVDELKKIREEQALLQQFDPALFGDYGPFEALLGRATGGADYDRYEDLMGGFWQAQSGAARQDKIAELETLEAELIDNLKMFFTGEEGMPGFVNVVKDGITNALGTMDADYDLPPIFQAIIERTDKAFEELGISAAGAAEGVIQLDNAIQGLKPLTEEETKAVELYMEYLEKQAEATEEFADQMADLAADLASDLAELDADYYEDIASLREDFEDSELEDIEKHNRQREKQEEAHRLKMARMAEDHEDRLFDLVGKRDALGIVRENRQYEKTRRRAEEDFAIQQRDSNENFERSRKDRRKQFEKQMEDRHEEWQKERANREQEFIEEQALAEREHLEEMDRLRREYWDKINAELGYYTTSKEQLAAYHRDMLRDTGKFLRDNEALWDDYMASLPTPSAYGGWTEQDEGGWEGKATGGYAGSGIYRLGEAGKEYVMDAPTTRLAEGLFGPLNQNKLAQAFFSGAGGGSKIINATVPITISGATEPEATGREVRRQVLIAMGDLLEQVE